MFSAGSVPWLIAVSLFAAALGSMLGMAGGVFIVPILVTFGGFSFAIAVGASLISVIACSCSSAPQLLRAHLCNVRLATVLEAATTCGALTGVLVASSVSNNVLYGLFALVLAVSGYQMLARRHQDNMAAVPPDPDDHALMANVFGDRATTYRDRSTGEPVTYYVHNLKGGMVLMYFAGILSAMLGIGSGVLKIPAMDSALKLPLKASSATSNFMIGVTGSASALIYLLKGDIDADVAGPVAVGAVIGSILGAKLLTHLPSHHLRLVFAAILALLCVQMGLRAFGIEVV